MEFQTFWESENDPQGSRKMSASEFLLGQGSMRKYGAVLRNCDGGVEWGAFGGVDKGCGKNMPQSV